jgi:hypothetical protein
MSARKTTPDVMSALMDKPPLKQEENKAIEQASNKHSSEEIKEKATFNLPVKLLERLEEKWVVIRKIMGSKQVSKTLIVEAALEMALEEFDRNGESSQLYGKLANNKAINP